MTKLDYTRATALTDLARGRLLLDHLHSTGEQVLWEPAEGRFYICAGGPWRSTTPEAMRHHTHDLADLLTEASAARRRTEAATGRLPMRPPTGPSDLDRTATAFATTTSIDKALREMRVQPGVTVDVENFDADPDLLGVRNGVVDLRDGSLRPYFPTDRITKVVDVDYDPEATAPRWADFLTQTFVDENNTPDVTLRAFVQRLVGYGITGHTREQRLPVLVGEGGTGKGTFLNTLASIFAAHTATAAFETFEERPRGTATDDLARLRGHRLVMASEGTAGAPMAEAVLKRVTGGDPITARHLYRDAFTFTPTFLVLLASNHKPEFSGADSGIWRRVLLVPFLAKVDPTKVDEHLGQALRDEAAGILAWAVAGAVAWHERGLEVPTSISSATAEYREDSHPLADFVAECCEITGEYADVVSLKEFHQRHVDWSTATGSAVASARKLKTMAVTLDGVTDYKRHQAVVLRGVRILTVAEQAAKASALTRPDYLTAVRS